MKRGVSFFLGVGLVLGGVIAPVSNLYVDEAYAEGDVVVLEDCTGIGNCIAVTNTAELRDAFENEVSTVLVKGDFDLIDDLRTSADMTLYLNNYTITSNGYSIINQEGDLTIYGGESGKIVETGGTWAPLYVYSNTTLKSGTIEAAGFAVSSYYGTGNFVMDGGTICGGTLNGVLVSNDAKFTMNEGVITYGGEYSAVSVDTGTVTMNGGKITASGEGAGVVTWNDSTFTMNGGVVEATGTSFALSGNGTTNPESANYGANTVWNLNAGKLSSENIAVYHPQKDGVATIKDGMTIYGKNNGVEIRAGKVTILGGKISVADTTEYDYKANGNGTTSTGTAVTVSQHTTKLPIEVKIEGGEFVAPVAFNEINPQGNSVEDLAQIELSITGGTFVANDGIEYVVHSEDFENFISGGTFSLDPTYSGDKMKNYIADGYVAARDGEEGWKVVDPEKMEDNTEVDVDEKTGETVIMPVKVDLAEAELKSEGTKEGAIRGDIKFNEEFIADRKAEFEIAELDEEEFKGLIISEDKGGDLVLGFDASLYDRDGEIVEAKDNSIKIRVELTKEQYELLETYDKVQVVYFENGEEKERFEAKLGTLEGFYYVEFTTTHLSTYGVVGVDEVEETEEEEEAKTANTGRFTASSLNGGGASENNMTVFVAKKLAAVVLAFISVKMFQCVVNSEKVRRGIRG